MVTEKEWQEFREQHISRTFPEGSSIISVTGNWYDTAAKQLITEPTYKVIYFYKRSGSISTRIDTLREIYKRAFQQQSVLRVDRKVKASF